MNSAEVINGTEKPLHLKYAAPVFDELNGEIRTLRTLHEQAREMALKEAADASSLRDVVRSAREACGHFQEMAGSDVKLASAFSFVEAILSEVE